MFEKRMLLQAKGFLLPIRTSLAAKKRLCAAVKRQRAGGAIDFACFFSTIVMKKEEAL
jgi:hypothetical protein